MPLVWLLLLLILTAAASELGRFAPSEVIRYGTNVDSEAIEDAICKASQLTSLRIGDFVAVELAPSALLSERKEGSLEFKATFCENEIFSFRIIF